MPSKLALPIMAAGALSQAAKPIGKGFWSQVDDLISRGGAGGLSTPASRGPLPLPPISQRTLGFPGSVPTRVRGQVTLLPKTHPASTGPEAMSVYRGPPLTLGPDGAPFKGGSSLGRGLRRTGSAINPLTNKMRYAKGLGALGAGSVVLGNLIGEDDNAFDPSTVRGLDYGIGTTTDTDVTSGSGTNVSGTPDYYGSAIDDLDAYYDQLIEQEESIQLARERAERDMYAQGNRYIADTHAQMQANTRVTKEEEAELIRAMNEDTEMLSTGNRGIGVTGSEPEQDRLQGRVGREYGYMQDMVSGEGNVMNELAAQMQAVRPMRQEEAFRRNDAQHAETIRQLQLARQEAVLNERLGLARSMSEADSQESMAIRAEQRGVNVPVSPIERSQYYNQSLQAIGAHFGDLNRIPPSIQSELDNFMATGDANRLNNAQVLAGQYPEGWAPGDNNGEGWFDRLTNVPFVDLPSWMVPGR